MAKIKLKINVLIDRIKQHPGLSSKELFEEVNAAHITSYATVKRMLQHLIEKDFVTTTGIGKATTYHISKSYDVIHEVNIETYFKKELDERKVRKSFNHELITETLNKISIFSEEELQHLNDLHNAFKKKIATLSKKEYKTELERLAIDLSWKSSQIELHRLLIKELGVENNIRKRTVGISGTNYKPLDNEFQIREAMEELCGLVNLKKNVFEKALLVLVLISYIQPFGDGNKRTARIISNAILMNHKYCPLSFRTVDSLDYKKAMLIFYEQNNLSAVKQIFISQFKFAVETYF
ncbi:MAG: Fic family protein [Sphingobacteriaceae bacterium]|nr:Fic family protein [Sphingobacteriaceae bacterium]